jgi:hypothetical protein
VKAVQWGTRSAKQAGLPRIRFRGKACIIGLAGRDLPAHADLPPDPDEAVVMAKGGANS